MEARYYVQPFAGWFGLVDRATGVVVRNDFTRKADAVREMKRLNDAELHIIRTAPPVQSPPSPLPPPPG